MVHYALRRLMHQAALDKALDPDRMSFTHKPLTGRHCP